MWQNANKSDSGFTWPDTLGGATTNLNNLLYQGAAPRLTEKN